MLRNIKTTFFVLLIVIESIVAKDETARKLVKMATSIKYVVPTRTSFTTLPLTCYSTVDVTGPCRRRRSHQERPAILSFDTGEVLDIDRILPTPTRKLETTASPVDHSITSTVESSKIDDGQGSLPRWFPPYPRFGLTYVDIQTSTITHTSWATVISGERRFVISGCVPSDFLYATCSESSTSTDD